MDSSIRGASHVGSDRLKSLALRIGSSFLICLLAGAALAYPDNDHSALAPLAKDEILAAVQILKQAAKVSNDSRFSLITYVSPRSRKCWTHGLEANRTVKPLWWSTNGAAIRHLRQSWISVQGR